MKPLAPEHSAELRAQIEWAREIEPVFNIDVIDQQGEVVAKVEKQLYVRKKK